MIDASSRSAAAGEAGSSADHLTGTLALIELEFAELPALKITLRQAARLWALGPEDCRQALDALVDRGVLARTHDGAYQRVGGGRA